MNTHFEDVYAAFVVWSRDERMYVGDGEAWRAALRCDAARFTKDGALKYINSQDHPENYLIEDAK